MENKVLSKDEFLKHFTPTNKVLIYYSVDQIKLEYEIFKLEYLLNGFIRHSIPSEELEESLKNKINITLYIYNNLMFSMYLLSSAINDNNIINALKDSFYDLYKESFNIFYDYKEDKINWKEHDKCLKTFEINLKKNLIILRNLQLPQAQTFFLCYARTIFEKTQFQAPFRLTQEEAMRDSLGLTNLWKEYFIRWDINKLMLSTK